ncbi:MAG: hypothetical protein LBC74_01200 [Planctomycetaceae bacterium]|jgi:hypothetical protein|nr:hypothetical protein [Planctomycetaceae bacterium]
MLGFCKKLIERFIAFFLERESKKRNSRFKKRRLGFEVLESRELLSANPLDYSSTDWDWENDS